MKVFYGVISNDYLTLKRVLLSSELPKIPMNEYTSDSATEGWNEILKDAEKSKYDIAVMSHQDIYYPKEWLLKMEAGLKKLPESWLIAGYYGIGKDFKPCGGIWDRRMTMRLKTPHDLPCEVLNVDGCAFIVNLNKGFRFEELKGFDLYDVYAGLKAKEMGGTVWAIDAPVEHFATRPWNWKPNEVFMENWNWLKQRFPNEKLVSTCYYDPV